MKKFLRVIVLLLVVSVMGMACQGSRDASEMVGTYINADNPAEYLELHSDGTYSLMEYGTDFTGKWQVEGNTLSITYDHMPASFKSTATIRGDTIVDETDKTWIRQE